MKPSILLYNPPSAVEGEPWIIPILLNILSICSLVDENKYDIKIIQDFPKIALGKMIKQLPQAVCLAISTMTGNQILNGLYVAKEIRKLRPELPLIWGGYHPTALPEETLKNENVDIVIRGYGEIVFPKIVDRLANHQDIGDLLGVSFKKNGKIFHNQDEEVPDLNSLPILPFHFFDVEEFFKNTNSRTLHYISSRGCPHQCGFCADFVVYKRRWNALSADRVISDLEFLKKRYNFNVVRFYDSNLFVDEQRIREICWGVLEKRLNFQWLKCNGDAFILANYQNETLELMSKAGVSNILIGMESGYVPALECINKKATIKENLEAVKKLHKFGISIGFSFIFGFPYDLPPEKMEEEHLKELKATMQAIADFSCEYIEGDYYLLFIFTPYPGVRLTPRYQQLGWMPPNNLQEWGKINLNTQSSPWISKKSLKTYGQCLKINWFLMHKLSRNVLRGAKSAYFKKIAIFVDNLAVNFLSKRIKQGKLGLPILLEAVKFYYSAKGRVQTAGVETVFKSLYGKLFARITK